MFGVRHIIDREFPEYQTEINRLKGNDPDFMRLLVEYDETDKKSMDWNSRVCRFPTITLAA